MKKTILTLALALTLSRAAFAQNTDVWTGPGSLFDVQGKSLGNYNLVVERTKSGSQILSLITVTLPDGAIQKQQCSITETSATAWKSECDHGKGGGHCFGEGLCISYEENSMGRAFSTTIVMDGADNMRLVRTELQNGRAVRFFREKLQKNK